jgi:hypothetical protein
MMIKEVAASLYAWDLADEGIESCGRTLTERANVNSIYLVGIMHHEKRPLTSLFYTHDPRRKWYAPENSRIYYPMDAKNFGDTPLKPMYSERDFLKGTDWLETLTKYGRKHGLKVGAEISHTFYDTDVAKKDHPDVLQRDINGKILDGFFCQNNDKVRAYMRAIFYDTVKNHDVDFIQTCMMLFAHGTQVQAPWFFDTWQKTNDATNRLANLLGVARGGCFCENCRKKATVMGYDWQEITRDMTALEHLANATAYKNQDAVMDNHLLMGSNLMESGLMMEYPGLWQFLQFRARTITEAFKGIYEGVKQANPKVDFRYNNYLRYPELAGLEFKLVGPYLDSVRDSDYTEQTRAADDFVYKRNTLLKIRRGIGFDKDLIAALAVRPNATPELLIRSLKVLSELGLDGISLGHYDGSHMEHLDAIKQGMKEANIELIRK